MSLRQLFINLAPYVRPYKWLVALTLTFIGSFTAQVNAWVLRYTVDSISSLLETGKNLQDGWSLLIIISAILLGKEVVNVFIQLNPMENAGLIFCVPLFI